MRNVYYLINVHIQRSLLSVCEICNLCTFLDKYLSRHYFMINKLRYFIQIYLVVALKHHVVHCSKVLVSWRQACVFHNVLYNSSFLQARCINYSQSIELKASKQLTIVFIVHIQNILLLSLEFYIITLTFSLNINIDVQFLLYSLQKNLILVFKHQYTFTFICFSIIQSLSVYLQLLAKVVKWLSVAHLSIIFHLRCS